jgi:transposase
VAIGVAEEPLGGLRVRASAVQAQRLVAWAAGWPERTWAVEGAGGLGHLLAQQLVAAGERVLDVQPRLGARVRLLTAGDTNKNDPNDARSVAIAALRPAAPREVAADDDHAAVLKVWSKRQRDLGRARTQVACRLHAVLCELVPGGISKEITAAHAARILESAKPSGAVGAARCELAAEFLGDLRRIDAQMLGTKKKLAAAVRASGTTTTEIFGVGPVVAATVAGYVVDVSRFASRDHFAAYNGTAPIEVSSGNRKIYRLSRRGNRRPATSFTWPRSPRSATATATAGPTTTASWPRARRTKRHSGPSSDGSAMPSTAASKPTRGALLPDRLQRAREGNRGTTLTPARPACTPNTSSSDKPLPDPNPPYDPPPRASVPSHRSELQGTPGRPLDNKEASICTVSAVGLLLPIAMQIRSFCRATILRSARPLLLSGYSNRVVVMSDLHLSERTPRPASGRLVPGAGWRVRTCTQAGARWRPPRRVPPPGRGPYSSAMIEPTRSPKPGSRLTSQIE